MEKKPLVPRKLLFPFIIVTTLFALWGFANDITNPLVAAFGTILEISASKAALVQFAFYGGYATMAFPAPSMCANTATRKASSLAWRSMPLVPCCSSQRLNTASTPSS